MISFENIKIVLVETSHPGNIGAAARAMKNMGFADLALVNPLDFPSGEATARAAGAEDVLNNASIYTSLVEAVADCHWVLGTSARQRNLPIECCDARQAAEKIFSFEGKIALVFGRERNGLSNEELALCHFHVHFPSVEGFSSLNLSHAVQVMCYELRASSMYATSLAAVDPETNPSDLLSSQAEVDAFLRHLEEVMLLVGFLDPSQPKKLLRRLRRLFNRIHLEKTEVNILRGFLSDIEKKIEKPHQYTSL